MTELMVRIADDETASGLFARARRHRCTVEEEVGAILRRAAGTLGRGGHARAVAPSFPGLGFDPGSPERCSLSFHAPCRIAAAPALSDPGWRLSRR